MNDLSNFISRKNKVKLGASLHWTRNEKNLSIENVAARLNRTVREIDAIETAKKLDFSLLTELLRLYNEKLSINVEAYDD